MNINLRFGYPGSYDYETILDQFSGTKINTLRTSSIPLVQFWKETEGNLKTLLESLNLSGQNITLCFEYPTRPLAGRGKSSMTDLMIIGQGFKIALEAKFTEYAKNSKPETIVKWIKKGDDSNNRQLVLSSWTKLIEPFSKGLDDKSKMNISYQFFHRTASACYDTNNAFVVYQVFYDKATDSYRDNFKKQITEYVKIINPESNLKFFLWEVDTDQKIMKADENPFEEMKIKPLYEFGKSSLTEIVPCN